MTKKQRVVLTLIALASGATTTAEVQHAEGLVATVRAATRDFHSRSAAAAAGYVSSGSCVSGPQEGAMGVHYPNPELIGDGALDASRPEILVYDPRGGRLRLAGVEYIVLAEAWHAAHEAPPVLMGQQFHYVGSPNRYGLPAFYELHVWAWKHNPHGMFVDWNPLVTCDDYAGQDAPHANGHRIH